MRISLGDVSLWFDVSGPSVIAQGDTTAERPVVVAVHGGPGLDHMTVKSALGPLAGDFQVVYFDLRGHGRSDHSSAGFWRSTAVAIRPIVSKSRSASSALRCAIRSIPRASRKNAKPK